ncbi:EAL domain-containing protein [Klebsiella sp. 2680]|uniref:EAL domain-containing protein n=1 Tax=Klebsiella sp. 2680 TaxID=2018037 RepID=UPI00115A7C49|nr:EAL domain-containing protein [Klebsiella sp. 2680]
MKFINKKKWLLAGGGATVLLSVLLTNSLMLHIQRGRLSDQGRELLSHAENVTAQIVSSISHVQARRINSCGTQAIVALREIVWQYSNVEDLGIVEKGKLVCTANWGMFEKPLLLPDNKYVVSNGYNIYKGMKNYLPYGVVMDMTQYDNIVSFTSPFAFRSFSQQNRGLNFSLSTLNGRHVFLNENKTNGNSASLVKVRLCSSQYDLCAHLAESKQGFHSLPLAFMALIISLAFIVGVVFVYAILSYLNARRSLEFRLKKALVNQKIYLEYQPIVCAKNERIVGVEALVRWHDKIFGQVSPELFISMAEKLNVYNEISTLVVKKSIRELKPILNADKNFTLAMNIGKYEINDPRFLARLVLILRDNHIRPQQIKIEITERSDEYYKKIAAFSREAMNRGLKIALDDFGTGASNLLWLTEVFYDEVKLDKFFVNGLKNAYKRTILMSILDVVYGLNKQIVFEGVESKRDFEFVKSFDENALIQGWYFYKAMPIKKLIGLVLADNNPIRE